MISRTATTSGPNSRTRALARGVLGALALAVALGVATIAGEVGARRLGMSGTARQVLQAVVCTALTVPSIVLLRRRVDGLTMRGLGLPDLPASLRTFGIGVGITAASGAATLVAGAALGWITLTVVSWSAVLTFLGVSTAVAFLYEALPEELALRGYSYSSLTTGFRRRTAALLTIVLFLAVPGAASLVQAAGTAILAPPATPVRLAPAGMDLVSYLVLLTVFGAALVSARITTGSIWASIGVHLTFLAINRFLLAPSEVTGVSATLAGPDAILLVPAYVLLATGGFLVFARLTGRRVDWRDREAADGDVARKSR